MENYSEETKSQEIEVLDVSSRKSQDKNELPITSDDGGDLQKDTHNEYSKKLDINGQKVIVVKREGEIVSGESVSNYCVIGSPEHVAALRAKIDELKAKSENYEKEHVQLERERAEAQSRSEQVGQQLDKLVTELKQLGHGDENSDQTIHATVHTFGHLQKLEIIADEEEEEVNYDRLIRKPRIRQYWHEGTLHREADERSSSYTELFWDIIFVAVVQNSGHLLVEHISGQSLEKFIVTFFPIFRIWLDLHYYLNVYSSEDLIEKFLLLWEMILVIVMGTHSYDIYGESSVMYFVPYIICRMTFVLLYLNYAISIPMFRAVLINNAWQIFIPCVFWIVFLFVPYEQKRPIMWVSIVFEIFWFLMIPLYGRYFVKKPPNHVHTRDFEKIDSPTEDRNERTFTETTLTPHKAMKTRGTEYQFKWRDLFIMFQHSEYIAALNIEHWSERLGIFAIICLGEGMFGIVYTSVNSIPDWQLGKAILSLLLAYNLHWIYFDVEASRQFQHALRRHTLTGISFTLIHFPLNTALIAFGSSLNEVVKIRDFPGAEDVPMPMQSQGNTSMGGSEGFEKSLQWLLCGSLAVIMYCLVVIGLLHKGLDSVNYTRISKKYRLTLRFVIATIYLILPLTGLNSVNLLATISSISLVLVITETYGRLRKSDPLFYNCDDDVIGNQNEHQAYKRYVRWRWGSLELNKKGWSKGKFKRRGSTKDNESITNDQKDLEKALLRFTFVTQYTYDTYDVIHQPSHTIMCGILFRLECPFSNEVSSEHISFHQDLLSRLIIQNKRRGPNSQDRFSISICSATIPDNHVSMEFYGAVLHLRGKSVIKQPLVNGDQDVLLWNGEIFDGLEVPAGENDTAHLFKALKENSDDSDYNILSVLQKIEGPYSIIYWQSLKRKLWFGRDCLGRRSLLWHIPSHKDPNFLLTSVGCKIPDGPDDIFTTPYLQEVPANGIYCIDVDTMLSSDPSESFEKFLIHNRWHRAVDLTKDEKSNVLILPFGSLASTLPNPNDLSPLSPTLPPSDSSVPTASAEIEVAIDRMIDELGNSVGRRVVDIPQLGSPSDARVAILFSGGLDCICLAALADKYIPQEESIDLLNVAFENLRIQQAKSKNRKKGSQERDDKLIYDVPDRITGRQGVEELRGISPNRTWNFVEVNVPYDEACERKNEIVELMAPSDTVMDLSIAMAFWFAVRGKGLFTLNFDGTVTFENHIFTVLPFVAGQIKSCDNPENVMEYESKARVVLVGVGADELLAGYSRHREAFKQGSWKKLIEEVQLDVDRISTRNLGRDDRIISSHSKESRFPYLSTNVVSFLCSLPMHIKTDMRYPRGIGEKLLLRHVARKLGLAKASVLPKRAVQFGARTAKMTNEKKGERGDMKVDDE
ncbi:893_t:CDS:10 [Acaulospora morrowiae]|uniref:893_t:CDS:1 n=1 Tax=Acaulospora morrowiae TaxID=94023 RepID=A0A9N8YQ57_9GLOM|nr:893_t:CDS:10 [Acaulospora morrowiae]